MSSCHRVKHPGASVHSWLLIGHSRRAGSRDVVQQNHRIPTTNHPGWVANERLRKCVPGSVGHARSTPRKPGRGRALCFQFERSFDGWTGHTHRREMGLRSTSLGGMRTRTQAAIASQKRKIFLFRNGLGTGCLNPSGSAHAILHL